ncbi:alpha/beta-hydrolase [Pseudovirgaria hyperparasitica]|uniref:Carboxylic ester hydrolase n=1 Tax=Pseudovirgaria hyperparasitica TaxID=470096 RepID=A0A6A6VXB7_9PEZI|nr:alpha/beta-hydrolase [Pseudovirgaria hyperparasitica]KAF2754815.1 alpha/beta-hydrolase [Pseudovirgaria hyperparasitica]
MRLLLISAFLAQSIVNAVGTTVHLDYATYHGHALSNGISQWLGMRYAAPPTGNLRFAPPQDPERMQYVQNATVHGARCIGLSQTPTPALSEDCLFINVYAPTGATADSQLPVYFFIPGGGFNTDSNANYNGSALLLAADKQMLVVTFNYRVASLGFLASKEMRGSVNNGLKDQRKAMMWVQDNIAKFGGNPKHVVLGGDSAGAASITLHLAAYGGRDDGLFHGTAAESQSFGPVLTIEESQYQYDALVANSGCKGKSDTLACLRGMDIGSYQKAAVNVPYPRKHWEPLFMYSPVIDSDFVRAVTMKEFQDGNFVKLPAIYGNVLNEGTTFCPRNIANMETSTKWLSNQFPHLNSSHADAVSKYFPRTPERFPKSTDFWRQCANAYGSIRYLCPGLTLSSIYASHSIPVYTYLWSVKDPRSEASGLGVFHTAEINAIWSPGAAGTKSFWPQSYLPGGVNDGVIPVVQGYWTSFVRHLDPNRERARGTPVWEQWGQGSRLVFETNKTTMRTVANDERGMCEYFGQVAVDLRQ